MLRSLLSLISDMSLLIDLSVLLVLFAVFSVVVIRITQERLVMLQVIIVTDISVVWLQRLTTYLLLGTLLTSQGEILMLSWVFSPLVCVDGGEVSLGFVDFNYWHFECFAEDFHPLLGVVKLLLIFCASQPVASMPT